VYQPGKLFASGHERAFAILGSRFTHVLAFHVANRAIEATDGTLRSEFSNLPRESAYSRSRRDFTNQFVEVVVKISAAVEDAASLREKK